VNRTERGGFLLLYTQTQGDTAKQVSMYDIGASIGLEKTDAGTMAESLSKDRGES